MGNPSFIAVQKVTTNGKGQIKVLAETIRLDLIRTTRPWKKTPTEDRFVDGEITVLYMMPEKDDNTEEKGAKVSDTKVKINESKDDFDTRIGAIKEILKGSAKTTIEKAG